MRASARQLVFGDRELVALVLLNHEGAAVVLVNARNRAAEMAVASLSRTIWPIRSKHLAERQAAGITGMGMGRFFKQCAAAPSYP